MATKKPKAKKATKATTAKKSAKPGKAAKAKAAAPKAGKSHSPLAIRVAAVLGVSPQEAVDQAVHELADRLGLHQVGTAAARAQPAPASAAHLPATSGAVGHRAAKSASEAGEDKSSVGKIIPAHALDTTPLAARTSSASRPALEYSPTSLPKRLYLLLDGRGLDGSGMPLEVIDLPCTMGSSRRNSIWINSPRIETHHAQIVETAEGWVLEDLGSEHGTLFDGKKISRRVLQNGDSFLLAGYLRLKAELR